MADRHPVARQSVCLVPDIALKTAIHAVALSGMPTAGEGQTDEHAEAPLEADAADGIDAPDAATGNAGIDASMPPRVAADVAGASPVGGKQETRLSQLAKHRRQLLYK